MSRRLLVFLFVLVITILSGVIVVFLLSGVIGSGIDETETLIEEESSRAADSLRSELGAASVEAVLLSRTVSGSVAEFLSNEEISLSELTGQPELLEKMLASELNPLLLSLERSGANGAFIVLDATVNAETDMDATGSRAGLYIRTPEPSVAGDTTKLYLRGFPQIAFENKLSFQSVWEMEFDVTGKEYYQVPTETARAYPEAELTHMYWWGFDDAVDNLGENTLLCSIPILGTDGQPIGVCGFEIGALHFRLNDTPDIAALPNAVFVLYEGSADQIPKNASLRAGSGKLFPSGSGVSGLVRGGRIGDLDIYSADGLYEFAGVSRYFRLFGENSLFADNAFTVSLLVPKSDIESARASEMRRLVILFLLIFAIGIIVSLILNRTFMKPIRESIAAIEAGETGAIRHFPELEIIMEKMQELKSLGEPVPPRLFGNFISAVHRLTPTERVIFEYYADGKSSADVVRLMFISNATLKTHNRHIYEKLEVASRDEMLLYIELIRRAGLESEIINN